MSSTSDEGPLACPRCARRYALDERFCPNCRMPLVYAGAGEQRPITQTHERARKVDPRYTRGEPVMVARASNQAEAEMLQDLLLQEGIPSLVRRPIGFDVPNFLAAGPRIVLVNESAEGVARAVLTGVAEAPDGEATGPPPIKLLLWILAIGGSATALWYLLVG